MLEAKASEVTNRMRASPLFADVKTSYDSGKPEVQVQIGRRRAADLGVFDPHARRNAARDDRRRQGGIVRGIRTTLRRQGAAGQTQRTHISKLSMIQVRAANGWSIDIA